MTVEPDEVESDPGVNVLFVTTTEFAVPAGGGGLLLLVLGAVVEVPPPPPHPKSEATITTDATKGERRNRMRTPEERSVD